MLMKQDSPGVHYQINHFQSRKVDVKVENMPNNEQQYYLLLMPWVRKNLPFIIGRSLKPRCFKNVKDKRRPCGSYYYGNKKTWMDSELTEEILRTLNRKCAAEDRKILLFIDNAPSHPESFIDCFSHVKIVFLPKNTTSNNSSCNSKL